MSEVPRSGDQLIEFLRTRHAEVMRARNDKRPGEFKVLANRAGSSEFVAPELVTGTCSQVSMWGHRFSIRFNGRCT
jgi:hypothetical protein